MTISMDLYFSTNVRVGTGAAYSGLDEVIDREAPLGSGAIKGLLRDEARWILPWTDGDHPFVRAVFGGPRGADCPWNFEVEPVGDIHYSAHASLRLKEDGSAVDGALLVKEEAGIERARLEITQRAQFSGKGLPEELLGDERQCHLALLHLAARATEKVGQGRTRGLGWVTISMAGRDVVSDLKLIWKIREEVTPS